MIRQHRKTLTVVSAVFFLMVCAALPTSALPILSGEIEIVAPPADASMGQYESNTHARLWQEQQNVVVGAPFTVNVIPFLNNAGGVYDSGQAPVEGQWAGQLPAGTYSSWFFHADKDGDNQTFVGTITFEQPVVGIIYKPTQLNNTDAVFGDPNTTYANGPSRGVELDGPNNWFSISITPDRRVIEFSTVVAHNLDNMRFLFEVPEPTGVALALCGGTLLLARRRR